MATAGSIRGKVVAITGGARGIGFATAQRLVADGARVAIGDVDAEALKDAVGELGITAYRQLDVTDPESFSLFLDHVEDVLGPLDVLVNNAGVMPLGPLADETDAASRRLVEINVLGVVYGTKQALQRMLPRRSGHIINIASIAGESYVPGGVTYCASKHAVKGFTESARREYRSSGVSLSQVLPTFTNTDLVAGTKGMPFVRNAEPEEVAAAVAGLIERPRPLVRVTRLAGAVAASQAFIPRRLAETLAKVMRAEKSFLDVDAVARKEYEDRVRAN